MQHIENAKMGNRLDIMLVKPVNKSQQVTPPLSLGYLATALRKHGFSVKILDCVKESFDYRKFEAYVHKNNPRVVGFQVFTADLNSVKESVDGIKKMNPSIVTIIGGPHPSSVPDEAMRYLEKVDFGFRGEAELSLVQLMTLLCNGNINKGELEKISGLLWRDGKNIFKNEVRFIDDLDSLGFPAWDLLRPQTYPERVQGYFFKRFPVAPIIATRGCPYNCTFCAVKLINAYKIRKRSIPHIIEEIRILTREYGIREIHITDDNFTFYTDYVMKFCEELIRSNLNVVWRCANSIRLDTINIEMLRLMKRSGCYSVAFGIESGSDRILQKMKKGFTTNKVEKSVEMVRHAGMQINGSFILGYPDETEEEIKSTIKFAQRLNLMMANFNCFIPLPGTEAYNKLVSEGKLNNKNWENFSFSNVIFVPEGLTKSRLKAYQRKAILSFYVRPKILINLVKNIRGIRHLCFIMMATFIYLFITAREKNETAVN